MNDVLFIVVAAQLIGPTSPSCTTINKEVIMTYATKLAATLAFATAIGIGSLGLATPTQAAGFTFSFGSGVRIVSQPTLEGTKTTVTLLGTDDGISLDGTLTSPNLSGGV